MKDTLFIIIFGVLTYLMFATIIGGNGLIGSYGAVFASYNHTYFGYISYLYLVSLLYPLYKFHKNTSFNMRKAELLIASSLLLYSFLLFQAIVVSNNFRGKIGGDFVDFLSPYIGLFGLWVFWFIITSVSILIISNKNTNELFSFINNFLKDNIPQRSQNSAIVEKKPQKQENITNNVTKLEVENKIPKTSKENIDEPSYLRESKVVTDLNSQNIQEKPKVFKIEADDEIEDFFQETTQEASIPITKIKKVEEVQIIEEVKEDSQEEILEEEIEEKEIQEEIAPNIVKLATQVKDQKNTIVVNELEENAKLMETLEKGITEKPVNFVLPSVDFLQEADSTQHTVDETELDDKIKYLIDKLAHFRIDGDVVRTYAGPVVSTFEFKPAANVKISKILGLQDDLAMALSAETIRIQAPIPGKDVVGIEIPNDTVDTIYLRDLLDSKLFKESSSLLTIALGKDIVGKPFITDLKKLPHLLIAGTTGSGKSVGINAMILSLLYKNSPDQLRLLMIDPKMLEFSIYNDIPHLLTPVITKPKEAIVALSNMVSEMERRYELMSESKTKNIENYNEKVKKEGGESFPYIVVIIDELADLMMTSGKDVEHSIARLAQMARASGIHLIVATQRPSVDVVTGLIKANLPSRISYRVGQKIDSKIILDQQGAESLLGRGDMLFTPPGATGLVRLHAPWSSENEIEEIVEFIKSQRVPNYDKNFLLEESELSSSQNGGVSSEDADDLYEQAKQVVFTDKKTSISYLQRKLQIGYNRSARIIEQLEMNGILSAPNAKGIREIL